MSTDDAFVLSVKYCTINNRVPANPDFFFFPSFLPMCSHSQFFHDRDLAMILNFFFNIAVQDEQFYSAVALNGGYLKYE